MTVVFHLPPSIFGFLHNYSVFFIYLQYIIPTDYILTNGTICGHITKFEKKGKYCRKIAGKRAFQHWYAPYSLGFCKYVPKTATLLQDLLPYMHLTVALDPQIYK